MLIRSCEFAIVSAREGLKARCARSVVERSHRSLQCVVLKAERIVDERRVHAILEVFVTCNLSMLWRH